MKEFNLKNTISALKYIAGSPPPEYGGFDPQTVEAAKAAVSYLEKLMEILKREGKKSHIKGTGASYTLSTAGFAIGATSMECAEIIKEINGLPWTSELLKELREEMESKMSGLNKVLAAIKAKEGELDILKGKEG